MEVGGLRGGPYVRWRKSESNFPLYFILLQGRSVYVPHPTWFSFDGGEEQLLDKWFHQPQSVLSDLNLQICNNVLVYRFRLVCRCVYKGCNEMGFITKGRLSGLDLLLLGIIDGIWNDTSSRHFANRISITWSWLCPLRNRNYPYHKIISCNRSENNKNNF